MHTPHRSAWLTSFWLVSVAALATALPACGGDGKGSGEDATGHDPREEPFGPVGQDAGRVYTTTGLDGAPVERTTVVAGTETIGGTSYTHLALTDTAGIAPDVDIWANPGDDGSIDIGGFESRGVRVELSSPLVADPNLPEGTTQAVDLTATSTVDSALSFGGLDLTAGTGALALAGQYTLTDASAAVITARGTVWDCSRYDGTATLTGDVTGASAGTALGGTLFVSRAQGLVAGEIPLLGWSLELSGLNDQSELGGGYRMLSKSAVIDPAHPSFALSSYDFDGAFDADKQTHAKLLLELRWADDATAKTATEPGYPTVNVTFGTVFGVFPSQMLQSSVSTFYPEEAGEGYVYSVGFVDQAAKNEATNGIAYGIDVSADTTITPPIRATARVVYKTWTGG